MSKTTTTETRLTQKDVSVTSSNDDCIVIQYLGDCYKTKPVDTRLLYACLNMFHDKETSYSIKHIHSKSVDDKGVILSETYVITVSGWSDFDRWNVTCVA